MTTKKASLSHLRKLPFAERQKWICQHYHINDEELQAISSHTDLTDLSDVLIESALGTFPIPLGLATGFLIDGQEYVIPMAIEEPSVIAAASYGAALIKAGGGFKAEATLPVMTAQIFLRNASPQATSKILSAENEIRHIVEKLIPNLIHRGGGFKGIEVEEAKTSSSMCVSIHIDVRDAMGANIVNTIAEGLKGFLKEVSGGDILMAILTNASEHRRAKAQFELPEKYLKKGSFCGEEVCRRIVEANQIATIYPKRAVTHNKGVMNGISALTLATGNDTRAVEAAAHFYAQKEGTYQSLTSYEFNNGILKGSLELPLPLGIVGGSISIWPPAQLALKILGNPHSQQLSKIAICLGLAQNLAALLALVTDGIQNGHMKLHAARIAYSAGARGKDVRILASKLWETQTFDPSTAKSLLKEMESK